ncbi:hypothetical protein QZH41_003762 [Actinostola sp. cb2023]|nr:hypothetical protein QZH41_003762 [Actinostola sp. cb2023]
MSESKRNALRARLRTIKDPDRLRREIRKIRVKELTEEEYYPKDPWENRLDSDIPEDVRQDMRRRMNSRFEEVEDFQNEIERRAVGLGNNDDVLESFAIREMLRRYVEDTKQIRDKKELRKRLEDLDALSAILVERVLHDEL